MEAQLLCGLVTLQRTLRCCRGRRATSSGTRRATATSSYCRQGAALLQGGEGQGGGGQDGGGQGGCCCGRRPRSACLEGMPGLAAQDCIDGRLRAVVRGMRKMALGFGGKGRDASSPAGACSCLHAWACLAV